MGDGEAKGETQGCLTAGQGKMVVMFLCGDGPQVCSVLVPINSQIWVCDIGRFGIVRRVGRYDAGGLCWQATSVVSDRPSGNCCGNGWRKTGVG